MKKIIILLLFPITIISCNHDNNPAPNNNPPQPVKQYSYWVVNQDSFSTNDVTLDIGKDVIMMGSINYDNQNYFRLLFNFGYQDLPTTGIWHLSPVETHDPNLAEMSFYYHGDFYTISPFANGYIVADSENSKAKYTLPPTWFVNYDDSNDSVLIHGVIKEP